MATCIHASTASANHDHRTENAVVLLYLIALFYKDADETEAIQLIESFH